MQVLTNQPEHPRNYQHSQLVAAHHHLSPTNFSSSLHWSFVVSLHLLPSFISQAMGNCFQWHNHKGSSSPLPPPTSSSATARHRKVLRVVNTVDSKILEYTRPMLVKDVLINFSAGFSIGLSEKPLTVLPQNYKLKMGNVYYLFPVSSTGRTSAAADGTTKRIKLIITKKELQELLSNKISVEEMCLLGMNKKDNPWRGVSSLSRWRPALQSIPEGIE